MTTLIDCFVTETLIVVVLGIALDAMGPQIAKLSKLFSSTMYVIKKKSAF